jgi:8-oxo-dGTP pyrophosphatase MutT (NUDIX family)
MVGVGICVLIETSDGFIPMTRRGLETPVYPGRLYLPGGGPKPGQSSVAALVEEIIEEIGLKPSEDFNPNEVKALALITDRHHQGSAHERPEIVFYYKSALTFAELVSKRDQEVVKKGQAPTDVWGIEPVVAKPIDLISKATLDGFQTCPPAEAALMILAHKKLREELGVDRAQKDIDAAINRINRCKPREFSPPIILGEESLPARS